MLFCRLLVPVHPHSTSGNILQYIESIGGGENQSWHSDFDRRLASFFEDEFGISVLAGTSIESEADIIANTWGNEADTKDTGECWTLLLIWAVLSLLGKGCTTAACSTLRDSGWTHKNRGKVTRYPA